MYYGNVTFVMALPRSRTAWIAETFDEAAPFRSWHDPLKHCESIEELRARVASVMPGEYHNEPVVIVDTAAVFFYPEIAETFPGARYVFVRREPADVKRSLARAGQPVESVDLANKHFKAARARALQEKQMTMLVDYEDLSDPRVLRNMWRFFGALDEPLDGSFDGYFEKMIAQNIQIPFAEQAKNTNRDKVATLFANRRNWL